MVLSPQEAGFNRAFTVDERRMQEAVVFIDERLKESYDANPLARSISISADDIPGNLYELLLVKVLNEYRGNGWRVTYDSHYNERYAVFTPETESSGCDMRETACYPKR